MPWTEIVATLVLLLGSIGIFGLLIWALLRLDTNKPIYRFTYAGTVRDLLIDPPLRGPKFPGSSIDLQR